MEGLAGGHSLFLFPAAWNTLARNGTGGTRFSRSVSVGSSAILTSWQLVDLLGLERRMHLDPVLTRTSSVARSARRRSAGSSWRRPAGPLARARRNRHAPGTRKPS